MATGIPESVESTRIGQVSDGSPAMEAGVLPGDVILSVDGQRTLQWLDVLEAIKKCDGNPITMTLQRGSEKLSLTVTPTLADAKKYLQGGRSRNGIWLEL